MVIDGPKVRLNLNQKYLPGLECSGALLTLFRLLQGALNSINKW